MLCNVERAACVEEKMKQSMGDFTIGTRHELDIVDVSSAIGDTTVYFFSLP
jgi:hypothetical protein